MELPLFTYHVDPVRNGVVEPSDACCSCCGENRGFIYTGPIRVTKPQAIEPDNICPWCIADGSAATRFQIQFVRPQALISRELASEVIAEVTCRTPGFSSWQESKWICHCLDACVFHGDLSKDEAEAPNWDAVADFLGETLEAAKQCWQGIASVYEPADPSIFKFVCRHCKKVFYQLDSP